MTATLTAPNGKAHRKQLAHEIDRLDRELTDRLDRLDSIIDALATGLPGAVADACREGARSAMKDAILEVLTNPELRALITPPVPVPLVPVPPVPVPPEPVTPPEPKPGLWSKLKGKAVAAKEAVVDSAVKAKEAVSDRCKAVRETITSVGKATGEALPVKQISLVALGVAVVVGVACLVAPHALAAAVGAVGAAATAVAVQTGSWLRRAARRFGLVS